MKPPVFCILLATLGFAPIAFAEDATIAAQRADIKKIRDEGTAAENSKKLLSLLRQTKNDLVALDCAAALQEANSPEVGRELLLIAKDKNSSQNAQDNAASALGAYASMLTADDVTALLEIRKDLNSPMRQTVLIDLAPAVQLSKDNVEAVLKEFNSAKPHQKVYFIQFAGKFLNLHRRDPAAAEACAAVEKFIMSVALPAVKSTPQLRGHVSTVLAALHSKRAVPLLLEELAEEWTAHQKGESIYFANTIQDLEKVLGTTRGYDAKLEFDAPANLKAVEAWLAWWKEHQNDAEFRR